MEFEVGKKYTTVEISDFIACTVKREIVIKDKDDRGTIFALKGKRKKFYTRCDKSTAVFEGHDIDLKIDSEIKVIDNTSGFTCTRYSGNALLNFAGTVDFVKDCIENKQLNPELDKGLIVALQREADCEDVELMVYPEIAESSGHAVAERILKKQLVTA